MLPKGPPAMLDVVEVPMFPNRPPPVLLAAVFVLPKRPPPVAAVFVFVEGPVPPNRGFCAPGLGFPNKDVPLGVAFVFVAELPNNEVVLPAAGAFPNKEDPGAPEL